MIASSEYIKKDLLMINTIIVVMIQAHGMMYIWCNHERVIISDDSFR